jgi:hypothetical protein
VNTCKTCGQPLPARRGVCRCGHGEALHAITASGLRGACSVFGLQGTCGCARYTPAEQEGES